MAFLEDWTLGVTNFALGVTNFPLGVTAFGVTGNGEDLTLGVPNFGVLDGDLGTICTCPIMAAAGDLLGV